MSLKHGLCATCGVQDSLGRNKDTKSSNQDPAGDSPLSSPPLLKGQSQFPGYVFGTSCTLLIILFYFLTARDSGLKLSTHLTLGNEATFGGPLNSCRMGLKNEYRINQRAGTFSPSPSPVTPQAGGGWLEFDSSHPWPLCLCDTT
jgi:hypothetical protein